MNSKFLSWNGYDVVKGLLVAVVSAVLTALLQMLTLVPPSVNWKVIGITAITSGIAYMLKQLGTNSKGELLQCE